MARTDQEIRAGRAASARRRRADPIKGAEIAARQRERYARIGASEQREYRERFKREHFFRWRAGLWSRRHRASVSAVQLARLWIDQRGLCALSGRRLGRDAHLDHIIHISRNGSHTIENLRWVDPYVNRARREMTDEQFVALCRNVAEWIGRRLMEVA